MTYNLEVAEHLKAKFRKLNKKDPAQFEILNRKIDEIRKNPFHFKPLSGKMAGIRRTHVRMFVLTFEIIEKESLIRILDYAHHDKIY